MGLVAWLSDFPAVFKKTFQNKKNRCVIAIRDNVNPFQKFGTRLFTEPYLNSAYDKVYYFTQYENDNKKDTFINSLNEALENYETVDIFLLAHGNNFYEWVQEIDTEKVKKIRMVYNTGCSGTLQSGHWMQSGVNSYVSHNGPVSFSPVFYFFFLRRYLCGNSLEEVVDESNIKTENAIRKLDCLLNDSGLVNGVILDTRAEIEGTNSFNIDSE
jgi:hypothetical protein